MKRLNIRIDYPYNVISEILNIEDIEVYDKISFDMVNGYYYVLQNLAQEQQQYLKLRYDKFHTYENIGKNFGVSKYSARRNIIKTLIVLKHPSKIKYINFGLNYIKMIEKEDEERQKKYKDIAKNQSEGVLLDNMEEISVRTYNLFTKRGFKTLNEINDFIKEHGKDWWMKIHFPSIKSIKEVEEAIILYGLNNEIME